MSLVFPDSNAKGKFFRELRLVHDDLCSYASAAAPYCAINSQDDNSKLIKYLNRDPTFWNCVLASLQTTAVISIGRLHDKAKNHNHFSSLVKQLKLQGGICAVASVELEAKLTEQQPFVVKILKLRHGLFAHTSIHAPLIANFGFQGLTLPEFRNYWSAVVGAMEKCDTAMFGQQIHTPKFNISLFESIEKSTFKALASEA